RLAPDLLNLRSLLDAGLERAGPPAVPTIPQTFVEIDVQARVVALLAMRRALRARRLLLDRAAVFHVNPEVGKSLQHSCTLRFSGSVAAAMYVAGSVLLLAATRTEAACSSPFNFRSRPMRPRAARSEWPAAVRIGIPRSKIALT